MTGRQFGSFLSGFLCTSFLYGAAMFMYIVSTLSFTGQTLTEKENRDAVVFFSVLLITGITIFIIAKYVKNKRFYSATGIAIPLLVAIYSLFMTGTIFFDNINYYQSFDKTKWMLDESKPFKMAKTMVKGKLLIGQTKQYILENLGTGTETLKNETADHIFYVTDNGTWELRVYFLDNRVKKAFLYEEGLSL